MSDEFDWDGLRAAFASQREQIDAIRAALTRPDVAALLRGDAVAVPKEPTKDMAHYDDGMGRSVPTERPNLRAVLDEVFAEVARAESLHPPLPWSLWRVPMAPSSGRTDLWVVRDADQRIVLETEHEDVARAIASDPIQALLRGEAVAVPKEPTDDMVIAGDEANPTIWEDGTSGEYCVKVVETIYRAMLAASPFAKEGKE